MEGPDERRPGRQWFASLFSGTGADKSHPVDARKHSECGAPGRASAKAQCFGLEDTQSRVSEPGPRYP
jgi:hypothetical protein